MKVGDIVKQIYPRNIIGLNDGLGLIVRIDNYPPNVGRVPPELIDVLDKTRLKQTPASNIVVLWSNGKERAERACHLQVVK